MTTVRLKYVQHLVDRHGKERFYFRRKGRAPIALPNPKSPEFLEAYTAALNLLTGRPARVKLQDSPHSLNDVIMAYYQSAEYKGLKASTRAVYHRLLERMRGEKYAASLIDELEQRHVRIVVARYADSPTTANRILRLLSQLCQFSIMRGWIDTDPTVGVKRAKIRSLGFTPWTDDDIAQFEAVHPVGTKPRLALALLLYTGQRRSDVVRMSVKDLRRDLISVVQQKTGARLMIPLHAELARCIEAWDRTASGFFIARGDKDQSPYTVNGFYNVFSDWCAEAGLKKGLSPHGLRKAAARRLAEAGCTPHQIAAITGHRTLSEVERYTRDVKQVALAREAIERLSVKP